MFQYILFVNLAFCKVSVRSLKEQYIKNLSIFQIWLTSEKNIHVTPKKHSYIGIFTFLCNTAVFNAYLRVWICFKWFSWVTILKLLSYISLKPRNITWKWNSNQCRDVIPHNHINFWFSRENEHVIWSYVPFCIL